MTNKLETELRVLDQATAAGDAPADRFDEETASLREAWLAFGQMLETVQPPTAPAVRLPAERPTTNTPLHPGKGPGMRDVLLSTRPHWRRLLATGLLAASLVIGIGILWMLYGANRQQNLAPGPEQPSMANRQTVPAPRVNNKQPATDAEPQWDDALDNQFEQVGWQMLCVQENQTLRTGEVEVLQYQMEKFRETIQADTL
jgi:hypothetical protein